MSRKFIVVRHSERLDEVSPAQWIESVKNNNSFRDKYSLQNDTPITAVGVNIAANVAITVRDLILAEHPNTTNLSDLNIKIYSSRLMRCVQTANQLACEFNLPIHVSSGLALTAVAVRRKSSFSFLSMTELATHCPGVVLHDCDDAHSPHRVSMSHWLRAIGSIIVRDEINIIVAHRETIRNLLGERFHLPYCCVGIFEHVHEERVIKPLLLLASDGTMIENYTIPRTDNMTTTGAVGEESTIAENQPAAATCVVN